LRAGKTVYLIASALAVLLVSCGPDAAKRSFTPGPLSPALLVDAAASAGHVARQVETEIPRAVRPRLPFRTFSYGDSLVSVLRKSYDLGSVVAAAGDEWEAQLMLKHWVHSRITNGTPTVEARHAAEILKHAASGKKFWCTYYAITYVECALSLGWQARKLGLDRYHEAEGLGSKHHGAAEVWSNRYGKWVYIDPQSDLHFEKRGIPLSAWEIRAEWLKNEGAEVDHVVGVTPDTVLKNPAVVWWDLPDEDETALFFWLYYADNAREWNEEGASKFIFPQDSANAGRMWYQNDYERNASRLHTGYLKDLFLPTGRIEDVYWTVGVVQASLAGTERGRIFLSLESYCPDFNSFEVSFGRDSWKKVENPAELVWNLKKGENSLALRTRNIAGVTGPETSARLLLD
jgi:hypothetical protein